MAVKADYRQHDRHVVVDLYSDEDRLRISDDPHVSGYAANADIDFYWDGGKLASGEREFVGIELRDIRSLSDDDLEAVESLNLPNIDIPELALRNVSIIDVLRKARDNQPMRLLPTS